MVDVIINRWYSPKEISELGLEDRLRDSKYVISKQNGKEARLVYGGSLALVTEPRRNYFVEPLFTLTEVLGLPNPLAIDLVLENQGMVEPTELFGRMRDRVSLLNLHRIYNKYKRKKSATLPSLEFVESPSSLELLEIPEIKRKYDDVMAMLKTKDGPKFFEQFENGDFKLVRSVLMLGQFSGPESGNSNQVFASITEKLPELSQFDLVYFFGIIGEFRNLYDLANTHSKYF